MSHPTAEARFWAKVDRRSPSECWNWTGARTTAGYGSFKLAGKVTYAHRLSYELTAGAIPLGLTIDHLCRNRACVNPQHMEPVTLAENKRRGDSFAAREARQTHCKRGHPFDNANTYHVLTGGRRCRACFRWHARVAYARRKLARST